MLRNCGWMRRLLGVLAAIGVLLAPIETMAHAQEMAPHAMATATAMAMAMAPAATPMGDQAPRQDGGHHHCPMPCCDLCFGGCSCAAAAIAPMAVVADPTPPDAPASRTARPESLRVAVPLVPHATPFALPPPAFASS